MVNGLVTTATMVLLRRPSPSRASVIWPFTFAVFLISWSGSVLIQRAEVRGDSTTPLGRNTRTIPRSFLDISRLDLNCPVECSCIRGYINCTSRLLTRVPNKNPRTNYSTFLPHAMWLSDNQFTGALSASNFSDWQQLKTLSLRNCSIPRVTGMTFAAMPRLAILDLSYNTAGMAIDGLAFAGTSLEALLLDNNPGIVFDSRAFYNATIRSVRIRRCKLVTLEADVFLPLSGSIESLFASENDLTALSSRFEILLMGMSYFDFTKNPWTCDCGIEWLVRLFANRLNRTRSLSPVDEWGSASDHGLPVPKCNTPTQRQGILIDALRLGSSDFSCSPAAVIGIDVEQLRELNQTRFRCSAAGDPATTVSWHFPRIEDEYHWAWALVENSSSIISPSAYSPTIVHDINSNPSDGIVLVSQAFLTLRNRPPKPQLNGNSVRLVCKAVNILGSASLMTNFDVRRAEPPKTNKPASTGPESGRLRGHDVRADSATTTEIQLLLTNRLTLSSMTTNIPIGYGGDDIDNFDDETALEMDNSTLAGNDLLQTGDNPDFNQQSIPQGLLVTVAVLIAIVTSSLGGCCLVIACSTSKVPNCPDLKSGPPSNRHQTITGPSANDAVRRGTTDRKPLLLKATAAHGELDLPANLSTSKHDSQPQTFSTFRSPVPQNDPRLRQANYPNNVIVDTVEETISEIRLKPRRHNSFCRSRNTSTGLNLFLSPPPPSSSDIDGIALIDTGAEMGRANSKSFPGDSKQRRLSSSQTDIELNLSLNYSSSPDLKDDKKNSSGYRSMVLNGSESPENGGDGSGVTSGIRSSEPADDILLHPVGRFSPVQNDEILVRKKCPLVDKDEITFI